MSQESCISQASTVPYELIENQDDVFIEELVHVDQLYFLDQPHVEAVNHNESLDEIVDQVDDVDINYDSDAENDINVEFEVSIADQKETQSQTKFLRDTCGCKLYEQPCSRSFEYSSIIEHREYCKELSHDELDLVIKYQLFAHRFNGPETQSKKHKPKERLKPHQKYFFNGKQVCRQTFCFAHGIERHKLQSIAKSLDTDGLAPRTHGNAKCVPKHSLTYQDREAIKTFICKYARDNALPLPGRLPNFKESSVLVLPSDKTINDIHQLYEKTAEQMSLRSVSLRSFQRTWHELCPYISISKPATDLCQKCQNFSFKISKGGLLTEQEKTNVLHDYTEHLTLTQKQRAHYREQCHSARQSYVTLPIIEQGENSACTVDETLHYSWDFAQQVHYPHHSQQCGPIFFKTPRKCNVFGMCSEGSGKQTFYLIDEAECSRKGANCVASLVHHFFQYFGHGEKSAAIHFDNCCGQNKNNVILWYSMWRVFQGLHQSIQLSMMIAGHTKFEPDWHFGLWKRRWRNSNAETMEHIAATVNDSSKSGHNIAQLVQDETKPVLFYEWRDLLKTYFKPLKNLTKYHHFIISYSEPGTVTCKASVDSESVKVNLLKKGALVTAAMPEQTKSPVMDPARQWYLFEQIREFCTSEQSKDSCCPQPVVPKKEFDLTEKTERKIPLGGKRKSHLLC